MQLKVRKINAINKIKQCSQERKAIKIVSWNPIW